MDLRLGGCIDNMSLLEVRQNETHGLASISRALVDEPIKVCPERGALHRERYSVDVVISLSCNLETIVLLAAIAQLQLPIFFHVLSSSQADRICSSSDDVLAHY